MSSAECTGGLLLVLITRSYRQQRENKQQLLQSKELPGNINVNGKDRCFCRLLCSCQDDTNTAARPSIKPAYGQWPCLEEHDLNMLVFHAVSRLCDIAQPCMYLELMHLSRCNGVAWPVCFTHLQKQHLQLFMHADNQAADLMSVVSHS